MENESKYLAELSKLTEKLEKSKTDNEKIKVLDKIVKFYEEHTVDMVYEMIQDTVERNGIKFVCFPTIFDFLQIAKNEKNILEVLSRAKNDGIELMICQSRISNMTKDYENKIKEILRVLSRSKCKY